MLNMLEIPHRHLSSVNVNWVGVPSRSMSCSCAMSRRESPAFTCRVVRSPSEVTNVNDNLPVRQRYGTRVTLLLVSVVQHVHVELLKSQSEILERVTTIRRAKLSAPAPHTSTHHPSVTPSLTRPHHDAPILPSQNIP